ncbi:sigma 54-interacting transcriptional regulator [Lacrimispora sp. 38-1]|uniref:sigma 54-interacting transcriptional regulator n=1 Tax=Lacrimispora sp. 38-1 TaxID=3125778 RepID=UPI003CE7BE0E
MTEPTPRFHVLIVCINPVIRLEFQTYLHSILGKYISFDTINLYQVHDSSQITGYQCILFSNTHVQSAFPLTIPDDVTQLICTRTFNHVFLDQIIRIPPNETVYLVNDVYDSIPVIIEQFRAAGITQYKFVPYYPECGEPDESIQYAITIGEPQLVPGHVKNVINIGNRILDISTINELCSCFHLPPSLSNQITQGYINRILQITKLTGTYYSNYVHSQQLFQTVIQNLPAGICLTTAQGEIMMMNRNFSTDLDMPVENACGKQLSEFLPLEQISENFFHNADYKWETEEGDLLELSILEISFPNNPFTYLLTSNKNPISKSVHGANSAKGNQRQQNTLMDTGFSNIITASSHVKSMLEYARRLALYDFPVLIQGETGTQKKMVASAIHKASKRRQQPLSILHPSFEDMAYNGSLAHHLADFLQAAGHGTLLIEHMEHLSLQVQDLLIEALQNGGGLRSGQPDTSDLRIIATADHDLYTDVVNGTFRKELFFMLSSSPIDTIPLRERKEDIPLLMEYFFQNLFHGTQLSVKELLSPSLMEFLLNYNYPGNVQELLNLTRYFFINYAAHPLILSQLPSYITTRLRKAPDSQSAVKLSILSVIASAPRAGRSIIQKLLSEQDINLSEGKLRGLLKELSEEGMLQINRTKGGCEITELGMTLL